LGFCLNVKLAERVLNVNTRNIVALRYYQQYFKGMPTLISCLTIKHADSVAKIFNDAGIKSLVVHGKTADRLRVLQDFERGEYDVICTVDVLLQGWNSKRVSVLFNLRPTYSWVIAEQRICRILRPGIDTKKEGIVVDFVDEYKQYSQPIVTPKLFGFRKFRQGGYLTTRNSRRQKTTQEVEKITCNLRRPIYVFEKSVDIGRVVWKDVPNRHYGGVALKGV